jgi:mercuric ion binding protein
MKFTKIVASLAIAGLVFVSCKKEEDKNLANIKPVADVSKEHKAIAAENVQTASFEIEGMTCAMGCAKTIEKELSNLNGVEKATVDFDKKNSYCGIRQNGSKPREPDQNGSGNWRRKNL